MSWSWSSRKWSGAFDWWSSRSDAGRQGSDWSQSFARGRQNWSVGDSSWRTSGGTGAGRWGRFRASEDASTELSRLVCQVLRHTGPPLGLQVRSEGYALVSELIKLAPIKKFKPSEAVIRQMVETNDKQRFALIDGPSGLMIRATQGHSIATVDNEMLCGEPVQQLQYSEVCCHGALEKDLPNILRHGLMAGGLRGQAYRRHIHVSTRNPGEEVVSGVRQNCQIAIYINLRRAASSGILFYRSSNNVILSEGVNGVLPPEFIESIWSVRERVQLWPEQRRSSAETDCSCEQWHTARHSYAAADAVSWGVPWSSASSWTHGDSM